MPGVVMVGRCKGVTVAIIRNPAAGGRRGRLCWPAVGAALKSVFPSAEIHETAASGDGARLAAEFCARGASLVVAVGGDGTIGEVAGGILSSARPQTAFSLIPAGTGSDFSRNFAWPADPMAMAEAIAAAVPRRIDTGRLVRRAPDGSTSIRSFVNIASFGVSGEVVRAMNEGAHRAILPGPLRFQLASIREILRYRPRSVRVCVDGAEVHRGPITAIAVANGRFFGGGMQVAPAADLADGLFDIVVLGGASRLRVMTILASLNGARHIDHPLVSMYRGRAVEVESLAGKEGRALLDCDGEMFGQVPARFDLLPDALTVKLPPAVANT